MLVWLAMSASAGASSSIERLKANYRSILVPSESSLDSLTADLIKIEKETELADQVVIELHERYPFDMQKIEAYLSLLLPDGSWKDIDDADTK